MGRAVLSSFTVRSYEIDSYAHLNNGVYLAWFEQGRLDWLLAHGFSYDDFARRREWILVARSEIDFRRPLRIGERTRLATEVVGLGRSSVRFRQRLFLDESAAGGTPAEDRAPTADGAPGEVPGRALCAEALTVMVFSGEAGGSIPIPADFRAAAEETDAPPPR